MSEISKLERNLIIKKIDKETSNVQITNNEMLISIVGQFDQNIKDLAKLTSTRIFFRGNTITCKGNKDNKILKIYEICNNNAAANNCKYNNTTNYKGNGVYEKWYLGKMEVNLNDGKKKKYLYFQFN